MALSGAGADETAASSNSCVEAAVAGFAPAPALQLTNSGAVMPFLLLGLKLKPPLDLVRCPVANPAGYEHENYRSTAAASANPWSPGFLGQQRY